MERLVEPAGRLARDSSVKFYAPETDAKLTAAVRLASDPNRH